MAKIKVDPVGVVADEPKEAAEAAPVKADNKKWAAFLAAYQAQNPVKFAEKKARGEFDKVPAHFQ